MAMSLDTLKKRHRFKTKATKTGVRANKNQCEKRKKQTFADLFVHLYIIYKMVKI